MKLHLSCLLLALPTPAHTQSKCTAKKPAPAAPATPNFIVISIDDLGHADLGPSRSTLNRTPHESLP